jgi:hypothetical protein
VAKRKALGLVFVLVIVAGCGGSSNSAQLSAAERDEYNERIDEINRAWEDFRVAGNACTAADAAPCFEAALESSGFAAAVGDLRSTVVQFQADIDSGECRSSLDDLELNLRTLLANLGALKEDAGTGDAHAIQTTAPRVRSAWEDAVVAQDISVDACF